MPSGKKEKAVKVQDLQGEENNLQEDEKIKCLVNKCLSCYSETMGHYALQLNLVIALFLRQALLPKLFKEVKGEVKALPEPFVS